MAKAIWNGVVVAESEAYEEVEGSYYFPPSAIYEEFFQPTERTSVCPRKGTANFYTLVVDGEENPHAAWYYPEPSDKVSQIKGHIAFWRGVEVRD